MGDSGEKQAKKLYNGADPSIGKATQFKKGQSGNPAGKPKGTRSLRTILNALLEDEGIDWNKVPVKNAQEMSKKYGKRGWDAVAHVMYAKAVSGDVQAAKALAEWAYGTKIDHTTNGKELPAPILGGLTVAKDGDAIPSDPSNP